MARGFLVVYTLTLVITLVSLGLASGVPGAQHLVEKRSDDTNSLEVTVQALAQQVAANKAEIAALKARLQHDEISISFHAEYSADPVHLGPSQTLVLDHVVINTGNGYDAASGHFSAPISGSYMFVVNFMGDINVYNYVNVLLDGNVVDYSISHGDGAHWDHVSETMVLHLNAGQRVWLQRGSEQSMVKDIRGGHWTTFSGFIIRPDP